MCTVRLSSVGVRRFDAILRVLYVVLFCLAWQSKILFGSSWVAMRCFAQFSVIPICHGPSASLNRLARAELESAKLCIRQTKGRWYLTAKDQGRELLEALRDVRHVRSIRRIVSCINTTEGMKATEAAQSLDEAGDWDSALRDLGAKHSQLPTFCVVCKRLPKLTAVVGDGNELRQELNQCLERRLGWSAVGRGRSPDIIIHLHLEGPPIFAPCIFAEIAILQQDPMIIGGSLPFQGMHHVEAWAIARSLDIQEGELVLDPMCGQGTLLAEAAIWWPNATYVGCDVNGSQLARCSANFAALSRKVSLHEVNVVKFGGIPLKNRSVEKIMVAPPWNRQFAINGRPQEFYEEMFRELFRVVRENGRMVLFVSGRVLPRVKDALEVSKSCWRIVAQRHFTITRKTHGIILILEVPRLEECAAKLRLFWEGDAPSDGRDLYEHWREVRARNFPRLTPVA